MDLARQLRYAIAMVNHDIPRVARLSPRLSSAIAHAKVDGRLVSGAALATAGSGCHDFMADIPPWGLGIYKQIASRLEDPHFPCLFARQAHQRRSLWYLFADSFDEQDLYLVHKGLTAYLVLNRRADDAQSTWMALVVCFAPQSESLSLKWYHERAWTVLQFLHEHDPAPWPTDTPANPADPLWSFCFGGEQMFVNISAPAHRRRRSRCLGDSLTLVIQPRRNFDRVAGDSPRGHRIREQIRRRMSSYDELDAPEDLGTYGRAENREWLQYGLDDGDPPIAAVCPMQVWREPGSL